MFFQLLEFALQFRNRLLEVEVMLHRAQPSDFCPFWQCSTPLCEVADRSFSFFSAARPPTRPFAPCAKSRIFIRLLVVTRLIRLHPGAQKGSAANYLLA